jgi:hypothetical protein
MSCKLTRKWSSPRIIEYAEKLQNCPVQEWQKLSLFTFISAGLLINLAIFALEDTKYRCKEGPIVDMNYLSSLFYLNASYRHSLSTEENVDESSDTSGTESKRSKVLSQLLLSSKRKHKHKP